MINFVEASNWKVGDTTLQLMWNVVQIKTPYQHFSAQICLLCSFPFLFNLFNAELRKGQKDDFTPFN